MNNKYEGIKSKVDLFILVSRVVMVCMLVVVYRLVNLFVIGKVRVCILMCCLFVKNVEINVEIKKMVWVVNNWYFC